MTCKDCIHYDVCFSRISFGMDYDEVIGKDIVDIEKRCKNFSDNSQWIHMPCKVGDMLYCESSFIKGRIKCFRAPDIAWIIENKELFEKEIFLNPQEVAEKVLKEGNKNA